MTRNAREIAVRMMSRSALESAALEARERLDELEAALPQWTTTPPTEPGLYWVWRQGRAVQIVSVVFEAHLVAYETGWEYHYELDVFSHWAGPFTPPPPPPASAEPTP
jgi:hypothetical protein